MSFWHLSTGSSAKHSFCANCSSSPRFEGCLLATAVFRSPHRCSMGFRSGIIAGHFSTVQRFVLNHSWVFLKCVWGHCPAQRPMTFDGDQAFWHWVEHCAPKCLGNPLISWCYAHIQGTQCQRQHSNPTTSLNILHVWLKEGVLFFEGFILFSVNIEMMYFTKKL